MPCQAGKVPANPFRSPPRMNATLALITLAISMPYLWLRYFVFA